MSRPRKFNRKEALILFSQGVSGKELCKRLGITSATLYGGFVEERKEQQRERRRVFREMRVLSWPGQHSQGARAVHVDRAQGPRVLAPRDEGRAGRAVETCEV